jgi:hypothetical protein
MPQAASTIDANKTDLVIGHPINVYPSKKASNNALRQEPGSAS